MTLNRIGYKSDIKEICKIKDLEYSDQIIMKNSEVCCGGWIMMWDNYDHALCLSCKKNIEIRKLLELVKAEVKNGREG